MFYKSECQIIFCVCQWLFDHMLWLTRSRHGRCFIKKVVLKILQYSQQNTCVGVGVSARKTVVANFYLFSVKSNRQQTLKNDTTIDFDLKLDRVWIFTT